MLLAITFFAGMQYKAYQVRKALNTFATDKLMPILDEMDTKKVQYPTTEDMDILPPEYKEELFD